MTIEEILNQADEKILARGKEIYSYKIHSLEKTSKNHYEAKVLGNMRRFYDVTVELENENVIDYNCNCPYDYGDLCKHVAGVLMAIENNSQVVVLEENTTDDDESEADNILDNISLSDLKDFINSHVLTDKKLKELFIRKFGTINEKKILQKTKKEIDNLIESELYDDFIDYEECNSICSELDYNLDIAKDYFSKGYNMLAFELTLHIFISAVNLASYADSSSGYLDETIDDSYNFLEDICKKIESQDDENNKNKVFNEIIKASKSDLFSGWTSYSYELISLAVIFVTNENRNILQEALEYLFNIHYSEFTSPYLNKSQKIIEYNILQKLDDSESLEIFLNENIDIDEFRIIAIENALENENYGLAEKLCLDKLNLLADTNFNKIGWYDILFYIYNKTGNIAKQIETAKELLYLGKHDFYNTVKTLMLKNNCWKENYYDILENCSKRIPYTYKDILIEESEWKLLLEWTIKNPSNIFSYCKILAKHYPKETYDICTKRILIEMEHSNNRRHYKNLCKLIEQLYKSGGKEEAFSLIDKFSSEFKKRRALLDELQKLKEKLN